MPWHQALADYATALMAARRSPGTLRIHRHYLTRLRAYVPQPWRATTADLRAALAEPTWAPETRKSARSTYVAFYRWGHGEGYIDPDPAVRLAPVTVPPGQPRPAPDHVLAAGLAAADGRERLMILLAAHAGLRCCEIAATHRDDLVDGLLYVTGKGGKTRVVPVEDPELLEAYRTGAGWMFPNGLGGHVTPGHVTKLVSQVLPGKWTAHTLRHRFATRAYAGTGDLLAVGALLGHSRPETTQRYVLVPPDALVRGVRAAATQREAASAITSRSASDVAA